MAFGGLVVLVMLSIASSLDAGCTSYSNSRPFYAGGNTYCAMTGSGCTECVSEDGGSCVTNGDACTPRQQFPF